MKPLPRSLCHRAIRLISVTLCCALSVSGVTGRTGFAAVPRASDATAEILNAPGRFLASIITFFQGGGMPGVPGPNLPNLDATRGALFTEPAAPAPIVSTQACADCTPCPTCGPGSANHPPVVRAGGPYYGTAGTTITVSGLSSFDIDPGDGVSVYAWNFGDGSGVVYGAMPEHTYVTAGNKTLSLSVTDTHNVTMTGTATVSIMQAPPPPFRLPTRLREMELSSSPK